MKLWNEEVENAQEGKSSKHAQATAADRRHFNELANSNGETAAS